MTVRHRWLRLVGAGAIAAILIVTLTLRPSPAQLSIAPHPLNPLTTDEITTAVGAVQAAHPLSERARFPNVSLKEPDKETVLSFQPGDPVERSAFVVVLDPSEGKTYEAAVDLKSATLSAWAEVPGVQPPILDEEYELLDALAKADPLWQEAMQRRGITDFEGAVVDGWAPGLMSQAERDSGKRLLRGITYYSPDSINYYGAPIEGLMVVVDLNGREVYSVTDLGTHAYSEENFDYDEASVGPLQPAPKPLLIQQPEGATFEVKGNEVTWQNWKFRYLQHQREGLTLYQVSYMDKGTERPVL